MKRREFITLMGGAAVGGAVMRPGIARAQKSDYPARPIRLLIGFGAGGGTDTLGRLFAPKLQEQLSGSVLIENRVGAGGRLAAEAVAKAEPDGYTLLGSAAGPMSVATVIFSKLPYNIFRDFIPISLIADYPLIVVVAQSHPARTMADLIAWLKANPAQANYPTPSPVFTLPIEHFKLVTGAPGTPITYRSGAESITSLLGGQTAFGFIEAPIAVPQISGGQLRALAVAGTSRLPNLPDVPTLAEAGVKEVTAGSWLALLAPAGTPKPIVARLEAASRAATASEDFKTRLRALSGKAIGSTAEELTAQLKAEIEQTRAIVTAAKLKFE